jgi:hypothetical protein
MYARCAAADRATAGSRRHGRAPQSDVPRPYADPSHLLACHSEIARTYSLTGMGRSFSRVRPRHDVCRGEALASHHKASDRYYSVSERGGNVVQRRHQIGSDGQRANALELEADYVIGSGNHARTFLHRKQTGGSCSCR